MNANNDKSDDKDKDKDKDNAKTMEIWRAEQLSVAARVIIRSDNPSPLSYPERLHSTEIGTVETQSQSQSQAQSQSPIHSQNSAYVFLPLQNNIESNDQIILGGVDVSFAPSRASYDNKQDDDQSSGGGGNDDDNKYDDSIAVYVVYQNDKVILQNYLSFKMDSPYIMSYLAMRELRPLQRLIQTTEKKEQHERLEEEGKGEPLNGERKSAADGSTRLADTKDIIPPIADVILVDGNGIMHERSAGIATCLGVSLNRKTIGVAKTLYCFDGLTREVVNDGVEQRVREFLRWCRQSDNELVVGVERSQHQRNWVVMCQNSIDAGDNNDGAESRTINEENENFPSLADSMKELSTYCKGFAIPLRGKSGKIWGAALLGHGGKHNGGVGTKVPIYISIGHDMSLQQALQICAGVSKVRIPEPVRQADLLGREWMRIQHPCS